MSDKKERKGDDILVTSELVESHILTGSFPVLRDSSWAESRSREVEWEVVSGEWGRTSCSSCNFSSLLLVFC